MCKIVMFLKFSCFLLSQLLFYEKPVGRISYLEGLTFAGLYKL